MAKRPANCLHAIVISAPGENLNVWDIIRDNVDKVMSAQSGWLAILVGGASLYLIRQGVAPFDTGEAITAPFAGFLIVLGGATLLVRLGSWLTARITSKWNEHQQMKAAKRTGEAKALEAAEAEIRNNADAVRNLRALTSLESRQLQWILHQGEQRVDLPVEYGLISKHILVPIGRSNHFVEVRDVIWQQRLDVLRQWHSPPTRDFPTLFI